MINRHHNEVGETSVTYAGMTIVVAVLILGIVGTVHSGGVAIGQSLVCKVGEAIHGGNNGSFSCGSPSAHSSKKSPKGPPNEGMPESCTVSKSTDSSSTYTTFAIVKTGGGLAIVKQTEKYIDPSSGKIKTRYSLTAIDSKYVGLDGGLGTKGEVNNSGLGADLSAEAGFELSMGDTWDFESEKEMNKYLDAYTSYMARKSAADSLPWGGESAWRAMHHETFKPPRQPDHDSVETKTQASLNLDAGLRAGKDDKKKNEESINLNTGLAAEVKLDDSYSRTHDNRKGHKGEYTDTYTYSKSLNGQANAAFFGVSGNGNIEGAMEITYNKGKQMTEIKFTQTTDADVTWNATNGPVDGSGNDSENKTSDNKNKEKASPRASVTQGSSNKKSHITTTTLKVTDENRDIVTKWLRRAANVSPTNGKNTFAIPSNVMNPDQPSPSDPFQQLLYEQATNSKSTYDNTEKKFSLKAQASLGLKIGVSFEHSHTESTINQQTYLGQKPHNGAIRPRKITDWCKK